MANTVSQITYANTFAQWLTKTNQLISENNDLATGSYVKNQGTIFLNSPVGLYVSNSAAFSGNTTFSGNNSSVIVLNKANFYDTVNYFAANSLIASGSISTNSSVISANVLTGNVQTTTLGSVSGSINTLQSQTITTNNSISNTVIANSLTAGKIYNQDTLYGNILNGSVLAVNTITANTTQSANINSQKIISSNVTNSELLTTKNLNVSDSSIQNSISANTIIVDTLSINKTFINLGTSISDNSEILLQANTGSPSSANSQITVNRGSANAVIRWYNAGKIWQLADVDTGIFYKIISQKELDVTNSQFGPIYNQANTGVTNAATALGVAQAAYASANNEPIAKNAYAQANSALVLAQSGSAANIALGVAQSGFNQANAAYSTANTKLSSSGGTVSGSISIAQDLIVSGNLTINGITSSINSPTLTIADKNLELANVANPTDATADGGGISLRGTTPKTLNWASSSNAWTSSENFSLAKGKSILLNGTNVGTVTLQATANSSNVTISLPNTTGSLISTGDVGTITSAMIADGSILNSDISAGAAIAISKLAANTISGISLGNNLNTLTFGTGFNVGSYNGSSSVIITANTASTSTLGSVKVDGSTILIDGNGVISANNTQFLQANSVYSGKLKSYTETVVSATVSTATYNIDLSTANIFDLTLSNNVTFTFTNPPASGSLFSATVILRQDSVGNRLATFTNAKYSDGIVPVLSTGVNQIDVMSFFTVNGGSMWFGTFAMANVS